MESEELVELAEELLEGTKSNKFDWKRTGNLKYEMEWEDENYCLDRTTNTATEKSEIIFTKGEDKIQLVQGEENFDLLNEILHEIDLRSRLG